MNIPPTDDNARLADLTQRLAAFVPITLVRQFQSGAQPRVGEAHSFQAAVLFSDISGFTRMSEELAEDGPRGAEELNRILVATFNAMVSVIHYYGGAIGHFYGDAMLVTFEESEAGDAARRALATAEQIQSLMATSFARVEANRPFGKASLFHLTSKIGVGYGPCISAVIGTDAVGYELVVTGPAVTAATNAEKRASSGQTIATRETLQAAGLSAETPYARVVEPISAEYQPVPLADIAPEDDTLMRCLQPFVPPAVFARLSPATAISLAEHRPATSIFVQFRLHDEHLTDPDKQVARLNAYYLWASDLVQRYGSDSDVAYRNVRINRVLTGDKGNQLHIIFGAPVAPDAPEQALRCALAMQKDKPAYIAEQQIGIAAGKVFAGPLGSQERHEYTIVGDVVNLSARLAGICSPGEVLTDSHTAERARAWVETRPLTPIKVKGKQTEIVPHRVERDLALDTQLQAYFGRWDRPLSGRDAETDSLLGVLDVARRGTGATVALSGEAGVGKTRLLAVGVKQWLDDGGVGQVGVCQQHTRDTPFAPWRDIWQRFFGIAQTMPVEDQVSAVIQRTLALVPSAETDVALWGELLNLPFPNADALAELTAEVRQERLFRLARRCLQAATREAPHLIILEGINWADQASLDLLNAVTDGIESYALCCIVTFRPQKDLALKLIEKPTTVRIHMGDLSPEQARDMLEALLGTRELPASAEQHLGLRDRDGRSSPVNPLFLEEALHVMMERGVLWINGQVHIDEQRLANLPVPDNIHGLLLARLDSLPPSSRGLLQVASVIGRQFSLDPLDSITPDTPRDLVTQLLRHLTEEELTQLVVSDPEWIYLFHHAMTHEVAYESLPFARRQALHAAVADWIVEHFADNLKPFRSMLAFHYGRANIHEEGLRYALEAAHEARDLFANQEAVELYSLAEKHLNVMGLSMLWETAFEIRLERAKVLRWIGDFDRAIEDAQAALAIADAHGVLAKSVQAKNTLAEIHCRLSNYDQAQLLAQEVVASPANAIPRVELASAYKWNGVAASRQLKFDEALEALLRAETICEEIDDREQMPQVQDGIAYVYYMQGELEEALVYMQRSATHWSASGMTTNSASALNNMAIIQSTLGRASDALISLNHAIELAKESSDNFLAHFHTNRANVLAYLGDFEASVADFRLASNLFERMNDHYGIVESELLWGYEYCCVREEWSDAHVHFNTARQIISERPEDFVEQRIRLLTGTGKALIGTNDFANARQLLLEAYRLCEEKNLNRWLPAILLYLAEINFRAGEKASVRQLLSQAENLINEGGGSADYLAPIYLLRLETTLGDGVEVSAVAQLLDAVEARGRYKDRVRCLTKLMAHLQNMPSRSPDLDALLARSQRLLDAL